MSALATADPAPGAQKSRKTNNPQEENREIAGVRRAWLYPVLSCAAVLLCILVANPFNEAGFNDDWSYARVAMKFAQTGSMHYNGWGSPILLFQVFWAAPWIRVFGFSTQILQVSMIPVALGFVLLVYATGRAMGLAPELATFASVATGTSPLFLPLAATFMTDVSGCFFSLLCVYSAIRCVQAEDARSATRWLWALALAGVIGGANRQIVWIAPVMLIPWLYWVRRAEAELRMHATVAYAVSGIAILAILHFFSQPYGPMQLSRGEIATMLLHDSGKAISLLSSLLFVAVFASMPAFVCLLPLAARKPTAWSLVSFTALAISTVAAIVFAGLAAPYGNQVLTGKGIIIPGEVWYRLKPAILAPWFRVVLSVPVSLCACASVAWIVRNRRSFWKPPGAALPIFVVFSLGYMALVLPGVLISFAFDRYMLPILPLMMLVILSQLARYERRIPVSAWCCLAVFACYGVATTHDYVVTVRARLAAAHTMERAGVAHNHISAGFEHDGWTELERSEYVKVAQYTDFLGDDSAKGFWYWFWNHTPNLQPDFVILNRGSAEPKKLGELQVDFRTWLPPFQWSAVVWKRTDLTGVMQAARTAAMFR
jgi:hypothetical protein